MARDKTDLFPPPPSPDPIIFAAAYYLYTTCLDAFQAGKNNVHAGVALNELIDLTEIQIPRIANARFLSLLKSRWANSKAANYSSLEYENGEYYFFMNQTGLLKQSNTQEVCWDQPSASLVENNRGSISGLSDLALLPKVFDKIDSAVDAPPTRSQAQIFDDWAPLPIDREEHQAEKNAAVTATENLAETVKADNGDWEVIPGERKAIADSLNHFVTVLQYQQVVLRFHFDTFVANIDRLKNAFDPNTRIGAATIKSAKAVAVFLAKRAVEIGSKVVEHIIKSKLGLDD